MKKVKRRGKSRYKRNSKPGYSKKSSTEPLGLKSASTAFYPEIPPVEAYQDEAHLVPSDHSHDTPSVQPLMNSDDVIKFLRISRRTLQRLIANNELPGLVRVGGQNRFIPREIESWVIRQSLNRRLR